jgi:hypothetical protein
MDKTTYARLHSPRFDTLDPLSRGRANSVSVVADTIEGLVSHPCVHIADADPKAIRHDLMAPNIDLKPACNG